MNEGSKLLVSWLLENVEKSIETDYIDLEEIKAKFKDQVTGVAVGNSISNLFPGIKVKRGRCKENWCKITQRYYGLKWKKRDNVSENSDVFADVLSNLPEDFFLMTKTVNDLKLGHFSGEIINGQKVLYEVILKSDLTWHLFIMGHIIKPASVNAECKYTYSVFETVRQLKHCMGVEEVDPNVCIQNKDSTYVQECVTLLGSEKAEKYRSRSKTCDILLPFKNSKTQSQTCDQCKKLKKISYRDKHYGR